MVCVICYEAVEARPTVSTFWPPCCARDAWFHRSCVQVPTYCPPSPHVDVVQPGVRYLLRSGGGAPHCQHILAAVLRPRRLVPQELCAGTNILPSVSSRGCSTVQPGVRYLLRSGGGAPHCQHILAAVLRPRRLVPQELCAGTNILPSVSSRGCSTAWCALPATKRWRRAPLSAHSGRRAAPETPGSTGAVCRYQHTALCLLTWM
ncbi:putative PHD finger protein 7 [Operophtera brumata]|uniref:Putative PHD finger protein 7 n=1 Tax=Operophtera brumata TaxID=104452 RepID=A0A0L7LN41_OPEBR|nr:putative PHD finger protein 7 [Operophtera brumata]